jgi:MFS family permease
VGGNWAVDILPATIAVGVGAGIAFNPLLLAAMSGVAPDRAGLASGVVNTAFMMGGAVGLAVLASLADSRSDSLSIAPASPAALNSGYHVAFVVGALFLVVAAVVVATLLRVEHPQPHGAEMGVPATAEAD